MTEIILPRGRIRELQESDLEVLSRMSEDREILEFCLMGDEQKSTPEAWRGLFDENNGYLKLADMGYVRPRYNLSIQTGEETTGFLSLDVRPYSCSGLDEGHPLHLIELGYFVGKDHRRQGIAEEALTHATRFCFEELKAGWVYGICLKENTSSQRLLKRIGFPKGVEKISPFDVHKGREVVLFAEQLEDFLKKQISLIQKDDSKRHENSPSCSVWEGESSTKKLSYALAEIRGEYPGRNRFSLNQECDSFFVGISGQGVISSERSNFFITPGDSCYVKRGERYAIEGDSLTIGIINFPGWTPQQYKVVHK